MRGFVSVRRWKQIRAGLARRRWVREAGGPCKTLSFGWHRRRNYLQAATPFPPWLQHLAGRVGRKVSGFHPNQATVHRLLPGQGICHHIEDVRFFGDTVAIVHCCSHIVLQFRNGRRVQEFPVAASSLTVLRGDARYEWRVGIPRRVQDVVEGRTLTRRTHIAIILRHVAPL